MRQCVIRVSAKRVYWFEWWGFSRRYMTLKLDRFGYGWRIGIGPLVVARRLLVSPFTGLSPNE